MTPDEVRASAIAASPPTSLRFAVLLWLVAIALGAAEAVVHTTRPDPPTTSQLAIRFAIYAGLVVLVLALRSGRNAVRWAVVALLGVVGTLSLVSEPISWLLAGGSPRAFVSAADGATLLAAGLRLAHLGAVLAALTAMFRPSTQAFFHPAAAHRSASGA